MVNLIWLFLMLSGIVTAAVNGKVEVVTEAALKAAQLGVTTAFQLLGVMAFWLGIMKIAEKSGLIELLAKLVRPITYILFPSVPRDHPAMGAIIMNISANILGLGNAATPFGLKAMEELQKLNPQKGEASDAMCTFLGLNTGCLTLLPATIIGVRVAAGSTNPAEIVGPTIFATGIAMAAAIITDQFLRRVFRRR